MPCFYFGRTGQQKSSSSNFPINDLPSDILSEILYKLPVKQIHRYKIVCKRWSSLISHPSFPTQFLLRRNPFSYSSRPTFTLYITSHNFDWCIHSQHLTNHGGKSWFRERKNSFKFLPPKSQGQRDQIHCLASSNGLLLCTRTSYPCHCLYYVCNPLTKQWITLHSPPTCRNSVSLGFVCNPNFEITQFKVVRIINSRSETSSKDLNLEIFDSTTNKWNVFKCTLNSPPIIFNKVTAIEFRGILHWECRKSNVIVAFDPNTNQFHDPFQLPGRYGIKVDHWLGVSKNHLYYTQTAYRVKHYHPCTIWRCDEFEGKRTWSIVYNVDLHNWASRGDPLMNLLYYRTMHWQVLGMDPMDCSTLFLYLHLCKGSRSIISFDLRRTKMKLLYSFQTSGYVISSSTFVQPSWPTSPPKLPQSADDNLHKNILPRTFCNSCSIRHDPYRSLLLFEECT